MKILIEVHECKTWKKNSLHNLLIFKLQIMIIVLITIIIAIMLINTAVTINYTHAHYNIILQSKESRFEFLMIYYLIALLINTHQTQHLLAKVDNRSSVFTVIL